MEKHAHILKIELQQTEYIPVIMQLQTSGDDLGISEYIMEDESAGTPAPTTATLKTNSTQT